MKARVKQDLEHMFDSHSLREGDIIEVEHFAYNAWFKITEPKGFEEATIHINDIELLVNESQAYGTDCRGGCE